VFDLCSFFFCVLSSFHACVLWGLSRMFVLALALFRAAPAILPFTVLPFFFRLLGLDDSRRCKSYEFFTILLFYITLYYFQFLFTRHRYIFEVRRRSETAGRISPLPHHHLQGKFLWIFAFVFFSLVLPLSISSTRDYRCLNLRSLRYSCKSRRFFLFAPKIPEIEILFSSSFGAGFSAQMTLPFFEFNGFFIIDPYSPPFFSYTLFLFLFREESVSFG